MSTDGTTDRGAKPPRTLFSLGRPGPKSTTAEVGADDAAVAADPGGDAVELACGACGATLIGGAAFCGECGTPVASLDDEPFDLVEEVPMGDLEDADFGEYVEELPIDDAPGVLYADADAAPVFDAPAEGGAADDPDGAGATVMAQPAAVLYADPSQPEPLPPAPTGSFEISAPSYGNADGAIEAVDSDAATDATETVETDADADDGVGAAPLVAGTAVVGGAVVGSELAAGAAADGAVAASSDAEVLAGLAATTDVASSDEVAPATASLPWSDAPAADADGAAATTVAPAADVVDAPTTVEPAVVPLAGVAAASAASAASPPTAPVAGAAYGAGPPPSGDGKSRTGLLVGVAAAAVLVLIVGGIIVAVSSGNKDGAVQTAQTPTTSASSSTTVAPTSTSGDPTTTKAGPTSTTVPTTTDPSTTETTASTLPTTASTQVPTTPRVTVTQAPPTTVVPAGRIVANPPAGSSVSIPKGGSTTIRLDNVGGSAAGCALTGSSGITASSDCSPSIPAGGTVFVTIQAAAGYEGTSTVTGVLEGAGSYLLTVNVQNG